MSIKHFLLGLCVIYFVARHWL